MPWSVRLCCVSLVALGCAEGAERPRVPGTASDFGVRPAVDAGTPTLDAAPPTAVDLGSADLGSPSADLGPSDAGPSDLGPPDGGPIDGGPTDAGPPDGGPLCPAPTDCLAARDAGALAGDDEAPMLEVMGSGSEWLTVTVRDTGSTFNDDSTVRARLELEALDGSDYDLVVYRASASMTPMARECRANEASSARPIGEMDDLSLQWPDVTNGLFATDGDGRILSVHVRHADGPCDGAWRLVVHGNQ